MLFEFLYLDPSVKKNSSTAKSERNSGRRVKQWLSSVENLGKPVNSGSETVYHYKNSATGVEARFICYEPENADEVGLAFEMDVPSPTFFAFEAIPAALCVAREMRFAIEILHEEDSVYLESPSFEEVLGEWKKANERGVKANGKSLAQGVAHVLESMWEFSIVRGELARRYGRSRVEVPELYVVLQKKTNRVGRMVDWEGLGKVALGESDWIRLMDPPEPLTHGAIYSTEELSLACKPLMRTVPQPIFHYLCEKQKRVDEIVERISELKKMSMRSFQVLKLDGIYDEDGLVDSSPCQAQV